MAERRTKESGIRKILGASAVRIFLLLAKEFALLVLIANVFAWPVAYFLTTRWLQNFAYRVNMESWIYILSGIIAFVIAILTISYQVFRAAIADPSSHCSMNKSAANSRFDYSYRNISEGLVFAA